MIGGVIVLSLFITAFVAMILVTQYYDSYQQTVNKMKQIDLNRFSENLRGIRLVKHSGTVSCTGTTGECNKYTMTISDLTVNGSVNVGFQIARVYVNTTQPAQPTGCATTCILNPSRTSDLPAQYTFDGYASYVNPGEFQHNVTLWLPSSITLPESTSAMNTITIVTTRGRQFSFPWPPLPSPPPAAGGGGAAGGTGLYIGPLVITFQKELIAYSTEAGEVEVPIRGDNGGWVIGTPPLIMYIKIQTDVGTPNNVYITAQSVLELSRFDLPGNVFSFFIVAPITVSFCQTFKAQDPTIVCDPSYGYYDGGNNGDPNVPDLVPYLPCSSTPYRSCPNRYMIPRPTTEQQQAGGRGDPVIVAFAATSVCSGGNSTVACFDNGWGPQIGQSLFKPGHFVTSFLGLTYVYNDNTGIGDYTYAVTLPFMAMCIEDSQHAEDYCGI
jgi:hypothetical protein